MGKLSLLYNSVLPPDPAEVAISSVGWRRLGFFQRLVKVERAS